MAVTKFFNSEKELFRHIEQFFNTFAIKVSTLHNLYYHDKKTFNKIFAENFYSKKQYISGYTETIICPELKSFKIDILNNKVYFDSPFKLKAAVQPQVRLNGLLRVNKPYLDFMHISSQRMVIDWDLLTSIANNFVFTTAISTNVLTVILNMPNNSINITTVDEDVAEVVINFDRELEIQKYNSSYSSIATKKDKIASIRLMFESEAKQKILHDQYFCYNFIYKVKSITDIPKVNKSIKEFLSTYIKEHFQNESNTTIYIDDHGYNLHVYFKFEYDNIEYIVLVLIQILSERF